MKDYPPFIEDFLHLMQKQGPIYVTSSQFEAQKEAKRKTLGGQSGIIVVSPSEDGTYELPLEHDARIQVKSIDPNTNEMTVSFTYEG